MNRAKIINSICTDASEGFKRLAQHSFKIYRSESIQIDDHEKYKRPSPELLEALNFLQHTGPVLYWIEVVSICKDGNIIKCIEKYRKVDKTKRRNVSASNGRKDNDPKVLYVGKVQKDFFARTLQHLGFFHNKDTAGLQIKHWAKGLDLVIRFHACPFANDSKVYISLIEQEFAKQLRPLIGIHK